MTHEHPSGSQERFQTLRDEIRAWIKEESSSDPNMRNIDLDDLLLPDIAIAQQIHNRTITQDAWDKYDADVKTDLAEGARTPEEKAFQDSKRYFHRLVSNRANPILGEKLLENIEKENRQ